MHIIIIILYTRVYCNINVYTSCTGTVLYYYIIWPRGFFFLQIFILVLSKNIDGNITTPPTCRMFYANVLHFEKVAVCYK